MTRLPKLLAACLMAVSLSVSVAAGSVATVSAASKECSVSTPIQDRPPLQYGDTGSCVTVAQGLLVNVHTYHFTITRNFLDHTDAAVREAQRNAGLKVDGIIGQDTWKMLAKSSPATKQALATNEKIKNCDRKDYRTICVIKGNNGSAATLYAIENGKVKWTFNVRTSDSRFPVGDKWHQTSEGKLKVKTKASGTDYPMYYDDYNDKTDNSNGQQAIRYSKAFAQCGYDGNLRGTTCIKDYHGATNGGVDISSQSDAQKLYQWSNTGTEIVILHDANATI